MSRSYRSYDEDWQRRKSVLIRSLFHDIPILSPVPEESNNSTQYVLTQEAFSSPPRPDSPLPPLIIEREPIINKHDEPEEYYRKLHNKIKKIYIKLFVENRNLDSIDYESSYNDSIVNDEGLIDSAGSVENLDFNILENTAPSNGNCDSVNEDTEDSADSTKSNGYGADFESMDTEVIDVVNYTASNNDEVMSYEEEESNDENLDQDIIIKENSDNSRIGDKETNGTKESQNSVRIDDGESGEEEEPIQCTIDDHKLSESEESYETDVDQQSNNLIETNLYSHEKEFKLKQNERTTSEGGNESITSNVETLEDVETNISSEGPDYRQITTEALVHVDGSQDTDERESRVYEDSIKSVILPTKQVRKLISNRHDDDEDRIEDLSVLEENAGVTDSPLCRVCMREDGTAANVVLHCPEVATYRAEYFGYSDPKTVSTFNTDETETTDEDIEEMRTPRPDLSLGTIPITHRSDSELTSEHTAIPQEVSIASSPSQNDVVNNLSQVKMSDDMNEILTSIFNESQNKVETPTLAKKRKLQEDKSAQASEVVTWDDIRRNFFVGTPKIFRLCACTDHICQ